ncbi:hypothetical protein [Rhodoferax saidenbachensis]|uniref:Uncharacterized protein n=1 Tax=Rhodoferax saidenbachensis TaxID=1484693 RepID=A0ABU1ZPE9_9BURK|nr:hypothetical protein [Rhodoferax saidenbachensis]MDR7307408.1 hypothetical protein [Rhodoferax saidenbachensis]
MAYASVLVLAAINCAILFFVSLLAVGGDGSSDGIKTIWLLGYVWIALFTIAALVLCARKRGPSGVLVAASTLPTAYVASVLATALGASMVYLKPSSLEFTAACKNSVAQFLAPSSEPVHTLAYEWGRKHPIDINYFRIAANDYVSAIETRNPPYPPGITLVENNPETADVLVSFKYPIGEEELSQAFSRQGLVGYELTVLDQRDNRTLARLRYFTDLSNNKACGPTVDGVLSIRAFVLKAIGAQ